MDQCIVSTKKYRAYMRFEERLIRVRFQFKYVVIINSSVYLRTKQWSLCCCFSATEELHVLSYKLEVGRAPWEALLVLWGVLVVCMRDIFILDKI
jgi:hypothetical protein